MVIRTHNVYPAPPLTLVFSADTLATLAAARRIVRSEQESVFVAGDDYDEHWMRPWLQFIFSNRPDDAQHFRTLDHSSTFIFPPDHTGATYLFDFELPPAYILDRYFDASLVQTIGTSPSGRPIILHHLQEPRPPFEPQWPLQARFDDQILVYGFDLSGDAQAGVPLTVRWYWRILADEQRVLAFSNQLFGDDGERRGHLDAPGYDPNYWPVGTTGITLFQIDIDPETPTGAYWLRLATYDRGSQDTSNLTVFDPQGNQAGKHLSLGPIKVHGRPPGPSSEGLLPSPIIPDNLLPTTFADQIGLLGYNLSDHSLVPGQSLDLTPLLVAPGQTEPRLYRLRPFVGFQRTAPRSSRFPSHLGEVPHLSLGRRRGDLRHTLSPACTRSADRRLHAGDRTILSRDWQQTINDR